MLAKKKLLEVYLIVICLKGTSALKVFQRAVERKFNDNLIFVSLRYFRFFFVFCPDKVNCCFVDKH